MRWWYAILKGSILRPQAFGSLWINDKSCAVAAGSEGSGLVTYGHNVGSGVAGRLGSFPVFDPCPICKLSEEDYGNLGQSTGIPHLNDRHRLTRPAIAYLTYFCQREEDGADPKDDALFREIFGPLEELDGVAEAIDRKLTLSNT